MTFTFEGHERLVPERAEAFALEMQRYAETLKHPSFDRISNAIRSVVNGFDRELGDDEPDPTIRVHPSSWARNRAEITAHNLTIQEFKRIADAVTQVLDQHPDRSDGELHTNYKRETNVSRLWAEWTVGRYNEPEYFSVYFASYSPEGCKVVGESRKKTVEIDEDNYKLHPECAAILNEL